jgi:hypothetical protein
MNVVGVRYSMCMGLLPEALAADRELWLRRACDAAIEATISGATAEEIADRVAEGIREGRRVVEIRRPVDDPHGRAA